MPDFYFTMAAVYLVANLFEYGVEYYIYMEQILTCMCVCVCVCVCVCRLGGLMA